MFLDKIFFEKQFPAYSFTFAINLSRLPRFCEVVEVQPGISDFRCNMNF